MSTSDRTITTTDNTGGWAVIPTPKPPTIINAGNILSPLEEVEERKEHLEYTLTELEKKMLRGCWLTSLPRNAAGDNLFEICEARYAPSDCRYIAAIEYLNFTYDQMDAQTPKKIPIKFGNMVRFTHHIVRGGVHETGRPAYLYWEPCQITMNDPEAGLLIGYRTLTSRYYFNKLKWEPHRYIRTALVVTSSKSDPIRVAVQGMELA